MSQFPNRAALWLNKLAPDAPLMSGLCPSVRWQTARLMAKTCVLSPWSRMLTTTTRAAGGEVGLLEGWTLAKVVNETIAADADQPVKRPIVAVIDVPSGLWPPRRSFRHSPGAGRGGWRLCQSPFGRPPGNWPDRRQSDVRGVSGPRLPANRLIAFNDSGVLVHAMGKASAARITLRTVEALEKLAATIPPMAYDVSNYATLGLLSALLDINNPDAPDDHDLSLVSNTLRDAIADARTDASLKCRGRGKPPQLATGSRSHARQLVRRSYVSSRRKPAGSRPRSA